MLSRSLQLAALASLPLFVSACDQASSPGGPDMQTSSPDLATPSRFGLVRITGTTNGSSAIATFIDTQQVDANCQHRTAGECVLYTCAGTTFVQPNAGDLNITGGTQAVALSARTDGSYKPYDATSMVTFAAGQKLAVNAAGGMVPAFRTELTPPNATFSLTTPDGSRQNIVFNLNRTADYQVAWTPLSAGTRVHAEINQNTDSNRGLIIDCDFDGSTGTGTIPASLLGDLQLTSSSTLTPVGTFTIGPSTSMSLKSGGYDIAVFGMANGRSGSANITNQ